MPEKLFVARETAGQERVDDGRVRHRGPLAAHPHRKPVGRSFVLGKVDKGGRVQPQGQAGDRVDPSGLPLAGASPAPRAGGFRLHGRDLEPFGPVCRNAFSVGRGGGNVTVTAVFCRADNRTLA